MGLEELLGYLKIGIRMVDGIKVFNIIMMVEKNRIKINGRIILPNRRRIRMI